MSSFLCFICHSTVNADTNEEMREKYREIVGMNLCPDSHLCYICCHVMNKLWLFRSVCLKRSLEYPVLFSEKGTLNLQRNDLEIHTVCSDDCEHYKSRNINSKFYHFTYFDGICHSNEKLYHSNLPNEYVRLEEERQNFDEFGSNLKYCDTNNDDHINSINKNYNYNVEKSKEDVSDEDFVLNTNIQDSTQVQIMGDHLDLKQEYDNDDDDDGVETRESFGPDDEETCKADAKSIDHPKSPSITETHISDNFINKLPKSPQNTEEIKIELDNIEITEETVKKKKKKKKNKPEKETKRFDKFLLSVEEQKGEMEMRRKDKKYIEAEFKCYNCALGFLFKDTYQAHMMRHEESNGEYLCPICSLRFATTAVLRAHTALHAERHRCLRCLAVVRRRHRSDHARDCYNVAVDEAACHMCGRVFKDSKALQQHLKRFHRAQSGARSYACGACGEPCRNQAAVRTHMIKHIQRKFQCPTCDRQFGSPHTLRAHVSRHVQRARVQCACGADFTSDKGLRAHAKRSKVHAEESFPCPICGRVCPTAASLRAHAAGAHVPHAGRTHACGTCAARYGSRRQLTRHRHTHDKRDGVKLALCHLCGASFKGNSKLNRHLREVCEKDKLEEELSSYYT